MTYEAIYGAERRHERDRIQWSDTFKRKFDTIVNGSGEGLIEGLYFGAAYAVPPFFEFSAVREDATSVLESPRSVVYMHPQHKVGKTYGKVSTDRVSAWFQDGGFEVQGTFDPVIPDYGKNSDWIQYDHQKIYEEQSYAFPLWPGINYLNNWVQEPRRYRWSASNEKSHESEMGPRSQYSAKYTFGEQDDVSPWLIPVPGWSGYVYWDAYGLDDNTQDYALTSHLTPINKVGWPYDPGYANSPYYPEGGAQWISTVNPTVTAEDYEAFVYSDQSCTFEVWITSRNQDYVNKYPDGSPFPSDAVMGILEDYGQTTGWPYYEELSFRQDFAVKGGQWNKFNWSMAIPSRLMPGFPLAKRADGAEYRRIFNPSQYDGKTYPVELDFLLTTVRFRVKDGQVGQNVYLDDVLMWHHYEPFENPFITVGVAKWIRDGAGAYVGADLWVKVSTNVASA